MSGHAALDVVIAGAGPCGLLLAAELALAGVRPVVLEAHGGPWAEPRANGLGGQVVPALDRRGLYEPLAGTPGPPEPNRTCFLFGGLPLDLGLLADNPVYTVAVPQRRIVEVFAAHAAGLGAEIRWGHELVGLERAGDRAHVDVRGPDGGYRIDARFLVGTDGAHSRVRRSAGIGFPGISLDRSTAWSAHVSVPDELVDPDTGGLRVPGHGVVRPFRSLRTPSGGFTWAPFPGLPPMVATLEWDRPPADAATTLDDVRASLHRVLGGDVAVGAPAGPGPHLLRRLDGGHIRVADRFRDGPVFLAGDAAHVFAGGGGPGLNTGLQDALNLGWKLAAAVRGTAPDGLLDTYAHERGAVARRTVTYCRAQTALLAPGEEVDGLRTVLGELLTDPPAVARLAAMIAGPDVRLEPGDGDGPVHPWVGRFAPDRVVRTADGPVRLAEAARSGRPLLVDPAGTLDVAGVQVVHGVPDGDGPAAMLVRPDGYVAWACDAADPPADERAALHRCARHWFGGHPAGTG